jgi:hypothetical protein
MESCYEITCIYTWDITHDYPWAWVAHGSLRKEFSRFWGQTRLESRTLIGWRTDGSQNLSKFCLCSNVINRITLPSAAYTRWWREHRCGSLLFALSFMLRASRFSQELGCYYCILSKLDTHVNDYILDRCPYTFELNPHANWLTLYWKPLSLYWNLLWPSPSHELLSYLLDLPL